MIQVIVTNTASAIYVPSYAYGFFSNLYDNVVQDTVEATNSWTAHEEHYTPAMEEVGAIYDGRMIIDDLADILPTWLPPQARPNAEVEAFSESLVGTDITINAKFFAEEAPVTYPVANIIKEEDGITYYETLGYVTVTGNGVPFNETISADNIEIILEHGSLRFTGYGSNPPDLVNANYGLAAVFKRPKWGFKQGSGATPWVPFIDDFLYRAPANPQEMMHLSNADGDWYTPPFEEPKGGIILNAYVYGANTAGLFKRWDEGTEVEQDVLRFTRKVPGHFGLGIMLSSTYGEKARRWILKDLDTNSILEDIDPIDFNTYSSPYLEVEVLSSATYPITLKHSPIYMTYSNAEDDDFASNQWERRVLNENIDSVILTNSDNVGWVGDFQ